MSDKGNIARHDAVLHAQLRLFCQLMLGSADAADCVIHQMYRRARDHHDKYESWPSERVHLFRLAAELCGVPRDGRTGYSGPGADGSGMED